MSRHPQGKELKSLYRHRDAKFEKIVSCLRRELYPGVVVLSEADRNQLNEAAEKLTDGWAAAEAEGNLPKASIELLRLLSEHQEICKRIIDILDAGIRKANRRRDP